jgi:threonine dehydratase
MANVLADDLTPCPAGETIAEGIAVKRPGILTREVCRALVDEILLVDEEAIERAIALLMSVEKTVVEGAGAAGLAAILAFPEAFAGKNVATILTGGNIDLKVISSVAMRELVRSGRLLRFEVPISDQPGALSTLTGLLGREGANIHHVAHERLSLAFNPKRAVLDFVIEVQDRDHGAQVLRALGDAGFSCTERRVT